MRHSRKTHEPVESAAAGEQITPAATESAAVPDAAPPAEAQAAPAAPAEASAAEEAAAMRDRWLRAEAELQNYRRRAQRDLEEARRSAEEAVLIEVIGALDDLERALEAAGAAGADAAWSDGVRLVAQRLRELLARHGVVPVDPVGEAFDPAFHEALLEVPAGEGVAPGQVVQVALRGSRRGQRALRAARVVVAGHGEG
jgi:molecular chaperone GrpE